MTVQPGKLLSSGKSAEIYAVDHDKVIKLFYDDEDGLGAEYESSVVDSIVASGEMTARSFGVVKIVDRYGIILERIRGKNILRTLTGKPWKAREIGRLLAQLHAEIHQKHVPELRDHSAHLPIKIELVRELLGDRCDAVLEYLDSLPARDRLCHGDFHPKNIISSSSGWIPIDWGDAYLGNPCGDAARTYLILKSPYLPLKIPILAGLSRSIKNQLCSAYIAEYIKASNCCWNDIQCWLLPMAAVRLEDNISIEKEWLLQLMDDELEKMQAEKVYSTEN